MKYKEKRHKKTVLQKRRRVQDVRFEPGRITVSTKDGTETLYGVVSKEHDYVARDLSCPSGKDVYRTFNNANRALKQRKGQIDKYIYRCEICGYYHLTTKDCHRPKKRYQKKQTPIRYSTAELAYLEGEKRRKNPNRHYNVIVATEQKVSPK